MAKPVRLSLILPLPPSFYNQYVAVGNRRVLGKQARSLRRNTETRIERLHFLGFQDLS
jgi:hypothetical protein